jgi:hypothetical protein
MARKSETLIGVAPANIASNEGAAASSATAIGEQTPIARAHVNQQVTNAQSRFRRVTEQLLTMMFLLMHVPVCWLPEQAPQWALE